MEENFFDKQQKSLESQRRTERNVYIDKKQIYLYM